MYSIGKFYQTTDVEDTVRALMENPEAMVISGGSNVLIRIRKGKLAGRSLVSIHGIRELEGIRIEEDGTIVVGPVTTFSHIINNDIIRKHIPMLGDTVDMAGGPQLRNIGTIGGNVCNGVTSVDSANNLCCLDAVLVLKGPDGVRGVSTSQRYTRPGRTVRNHDKMLTATQIKKKNYQGYGGQCIKYGKRNAMEIVTPGCVVSVKPTKNKKHMQDPRLAYGMAVLAPIRCHTTEETVKGTETGEVLAQAVGKGVLGEVSPRSSQRAFREFRLQLVEGLGRHVIKQIIINAGGEWGT